MPATGWIDEALRSLEAAHLRRTLRTFPAPRSIQTTLAGQSLINFGSNDYLHLAADPRLAQAVARAVQEDGWGAGASPLVTGHAPRHAELEARLARFEQTEAALLFPSGFAANAGTIAALVGPEDKIFSDARNHASIIDGCRLSRAELAIYEHCNADHLESLLNAPTQARRKLIVTDSVFSMDGDIAPLAQIAELAERYEAMLLVDEAHATGVFGPHGRGVCEALQVEDRVSVRIGTLSKALGSIGGFAVGSQSLIDWLANRARPYVFSTAPPPAICAAALRALDIVDEEPWRRRQLLEQANWLRTQLTARGWNTGRSTSQIVPVIIGSAERTMALSASLQTAGLLVPGIRPPSVPAGESLLRISLSTAHTREMLEQLLAALGDA